MMDFGVGVILFMTLFMMLVGLVFTLMPPGLGTILVWAAAIFYGLVLGWDKLGWLTFSLLTFLMVTGIVIDYVACHFGAKLGGASCLAIAVGTILGFILGLVASLLGTPIVGCLAGLVGMVGGVLLTEWRRNRDWRLAWQATQGYIAGSIAGAMARITSGLLMFGIFLARVYIGG
jgi:uncharacterized protein YqgC (DUF456 family)